MNIPVTSNRGRVRPAQPWRRVDVAALRIGRLARDLEAERDRHRDESDIYRMLDSAVTLVHDAATAAADPS